MLGLAFALALSVTPAASCVRVGLDDVRALLDQGFYADAAATAARHAEARGVCAGDRLLARAFVVDAVARTGDRARLRAEAVRWFREAGRLKGVPLAALEGERKMAGLLPPLLLAFEEESNGCTAFLQDDARVFPLMPLFLAYFDRDERRRALVDGGRLAQLRELVAGARSEAPGSASPTTAAGQAASEPRSPGRSGGNGSSGAAPAGSSDQGRPSPPS